MGGKNKVNINNVSMFLFHRPILLTRVRTGI
jgi:hypothetical protein